MENVELGIFPSIEFEDKTTFMEESTSKAYIAIGAGKNAFIYDK